MQQLLGDRFSITADANTHLHELFIQGLPANVWMVLASANVTTELVKLAEMADKVMEVVSPAVSGVQQPPKDTPARALT